MVTIGFPVSAGSNGRIGSKSENKKEFMMNKKNKANPNGSLYPLDSYNGCNRSTQSNHLAAFVLPIKPTLTHIPVIIASIVYGPKIGAYLGGFMGIMSIIRNTVIYTVSSYLFSPFVKGELGHLQSLPSSLVS